jgi:hypothetical protein
VASVFNLAETSAVVADDESPNLAFNMVKSAALNSSIAKSYSDGIIELNLTYIIRSTIS